jgi:O-antigen ligase
MTLFFGFFLGLRYSIHNLVVLLFWSSFLLIILSSIHAATGIFPISQLDADGRLIGIFAHKSYLARQALICTVAGLALMFTENNRVGIVTRLCAIIALVLSAGMLLLSESMTNLLMLPIGTGLLVVLCRHRLPGQVVLWMTIGSVLSVALIPVSFALAGIDPVTALFEITGKDRTLTGRTIIWEIAAEQIGQAPFLGVGFDAFWQAPLYESERFRILNAGATSPSLHNFLLEILVGTGALGLCAALVHIGYSARRNIRLWRATGSPTSACTVVLITMLVLLSLNTPGLSGQHEIQLILLTAFAVSAERGLRFLRRAQQ